MPAIDKSFDYLVPDDVRDQVRVGTEVRLDLNGRRVGGWVTDLAVDPPAGLRLRPIAKVRGWGPSSDVIEVARWAAWRWCGRPAILLRSASPPAAVRSLPPPAPRPAPITVPASPADGVVADALGAAVGSASGAAVVRWPPAKDTFELVVESVSRALAVVGGGGGGDTHPSALVVCPDVAAARHLGLRLRRTGLPVAIVANDRPGTAAAAEWAKAAAGGHVVVGARAGAWAPAPHLAIAVVLDEHDETLQEERAPTWHARDVVVERARRASAPCLLVSPCPSLEARAIGALLAPPRSHERAGWPVLDVVDRRREDPSTARSLISPRLAGAIRSGARVVCVLNRTGRSRLSACVACGELTRCERCGAAVTLTEESRFHCARCGTERPQVCAACGATAIKVLRPGVGRMREELEALAGEPVVELTGADVATGEPVMARIVVGTEAALHRVSFADVVAYVDFDQELTAPRYRATEQAMALLVRGARLVGGRTSRGNGRQAGGGGPSDGNPSGAQPSHGQDDGPGRLLVQTRLPDHVVLQAALHADPERVAAAEGPLREAMRFPPAAALAVVSGAAASAFIQRLREATPDGLLDRVELLGPNDGAWLVRAADHAVLCDALAAVARPPGRLRIEVDPLRT